MSTIEAQFIEVIVTIASIDTLQAWPGLLPTLVSKLSQSTSMLVILRTINQITKRYRYEARSNELFTEINFVMAQLGPVLLQLYPTLQQSPPVFMVQAQTLCNKIFYNLCFQDLPEFFEDNLAEFMAFFKAHYSYQNAAVVPSNEDEPGPIEQLQASVASIVNLYAGKYEEDFPMLPEFVELSWTVLTTAVQAGSRWDRVAGSAMSFLATVAKQATYKDLFGPVLQLICDKVILPNMIFQDADMELFEDDPMEFLRRDQEISDDDVLSRRMAAVQLTRSLMEHWEPEVTAILANYIQQYMEQYQQSPVARWREKDAAVQLFAAIAIKGSVQLYGVTRVNSLVNIGDFFSKHIVSDLSPTNEALHPILKLDAIKFVWQFRGHLTKADLVGAFGQLMHLVASHNHVLHTYAAMAVERILAIHVDGSPMFTLDDLRSVVGPLCENLLKLIRGKKSAERMAENDLLMKALMRVMLLAQSELLAPLAPMLVSELGEILWAVAKNPSNPKFNHFLFESIGTLVRFCCPDPALAIVIDQRLCPLLQEILHSEQTDFIPYIFQIYAGLVEYRTPGLPTFAAPLIQVVMQPTLWNIHGTVPALVRFLQACILKDSQAIPIQSVLGIVQVLLGSRVNDLHAFTLLNTVLAASSIEPVISPILILLLKKLQSLKVSRISSSVLLTVCFMMVRLSPSLVFLQFEKIQPGLIVGLMRTVLLPEAIKIRDRNDRSMCFFGLIKLLECPELVAKAPIDANFCALFMAITSTCLSMLSNTLAATSAETKHSLLGLEGPTIEEHGTSYASLQALPLPPRFPPVHANLPAAFASALSTVSRNIPVDRLTQEGLDVGHRTALLQLLQSHGCALSS